MKSAGFWSKWAKSLPIIFDLFDGDKPIDLVREHRQVSTEEFQELISFLFLEDAITQRGDLIGLTEDQRKRCIIAKEKLREIEKIMKD